MEPIDDSPSANAPQYQKFPIAQIKSSPYQARESFEEGPMKELAGSMKVEGLIQPIGIRLLADGSGELLFGERRLRAARSLGWQEIDARVWPAGDDPGAAIKGLIENLQRQDLNALERAKGYKRLADMGLTQKEIAQRVGLKAENSVYRYLALLDLPLEVQGTLPRGRVTEGHTRSIRQIPDKNKQIEIARHVDKEGWSIKETEKKVNEVLGNPEKEPKSPKTPQNPNLNDPIDPVWSRMSELHIPNPQGYFDLIRDYKGKYRWSLTTSPNWVRDEKDPPDATAPALAQELARALREMADALERAAGPVVTRTAVNVDGGQREQRLTEEAVSGSLIEKENLSPPVGLADALVSRPTGEPPLPPSKPRSGIIPQRASVPVPQIQEARYVAGNKFELKWSSLGDGFTYRLFRSYETDYPKYMPFADGAAVSTLGALIDVRPELEEKTQKIAVMAIDPQGQESELSEGVEFELKPWNQQDSLTPLPAPAPVSSAPSTPATPPFDEEKARRIAALKLKYGGRII